MGSCRAPRAPEARGPLLVTLAARMSAPQDAHEYLRTLLARVEAEIGEAVQAALERDGEPEAGNGAPARADC